MEVAKVFNNGGSQAIRLPKNFRFNDPEVAIRKIGKAVMLFPKDDEWEVFMNGINGFTADFMEDGRPQDFMVEREML